MATPTRGAQGEVLVGTSVTPSLGGSPVANRRLVIAIGADKVVGAWETADAVSKGWTVATSYAGQSAGGITLTKISSGNSTDSPTISWTNARDAAWYIGEFAEGAGLGAMVSSNANSGETPVTSLVIPALTAPGAGIAFTVAGTDTGMGFGVPSLFTKIGEEQVVSNNGMAWATYTVPSATTLGPSTWTTTGSDQMWASTLYFAGAATAPSWPTSEFTTYIQKGDATFLVDNGMNEVTTAATGGYVNSAIVTSTRAATASFKWTSQIRFDSGNTETYPKLNFWGDGNAVSNFNGRFDNGYSLAFGPSESMRFIRTANGGGTPVGSSISAPSFTAGTIHNVEIIANANADGTATLEARYWPATGSRPATASVTASEASGTGRRVGVFGYGVEAGASATPIQMAFGSMNVEALATPAATIVVDDGTGKANGAVVTDKWKVLAQTGGSASYQNEKLRLVAAANYQKTSLESIATYGPGELTFSFTVVDSVDRVTVGAFSTSPYDADYADYPINGYALTIRSNGTLELGKRVNETGNYIDGNTLYSKTGSGVGYINGDVINGAISTDGTTVRASVWREADARSAAINLSGTDSAYTNGEVRLAFQSAATIGTVDFDNVVFYGESSGGGGEEPASLSAPTNLASSEITQTSFKVTWSNGGGADGYNVFLDGAYKASINVGSESYTFTGLTASTSYNVEIEAYGPGPTYSSKTALAVQTSGSTPEPTNPLTSFIWIAGTKYAASPRYITAGSTTPVVSGFSMFGPSGGGYLTGLSMADNGTAYMRADVGGAYRKAPGVSSPWVQVVNINSIANERFDDYLVDAIACSPTQPDHVYMAVGSNYDGQGRLMRSTNGGSTWVTSTQTFDIHGNGEYRYAREPLAVQHDNTNVCLYGTRRQGLWRTIDGGGTWTQLTALPAPPTSTDYNRNDVSIVLIERNSARVSNVAQGIWAAVRGRGVYRSTNGGTSWSLLHAITANSWVRDAMLDSNGNFVGVSFDPSGTDTAFRVTPAGTATVFTMPGSSYATVAVHPTDPQTIWIGHDGIADGNFWKSTNGGTSWTTLNVRINNGTYGEVWPTQSDLDGYMSSGQIRYDPSDTTRIWFAEGMGAWWSNDLSDTEVEWTFASEGIQELVANAIVKPPGTGAVAVTWDRGVWKWNSSGKATLPYTGVFCSAWDVQARPDAPLVMAATVSDHQSGDTNAAKRLSAITTDGGTTWTRLASLANGTAPSGLRFGTIAISRGNTDNIVWAPSYEDNVGDLSGVPMRYSTDRGATWLTPTVNPAMSTGERISDYKFNKQRKLVADPNVNGKFYALSFLNGTSYLLTSTNSGASWTRTQVGNIGGYEGQFSAALTAVKVGTSTHLFWTTGGRGDGFAAVDSAGQPDMRVSVDGAAFTIVPSIKGATGLGVGAAISPSTNPTLFTYGWVGAQRGVYYSTNLGSTWTLMVDEPLGWHQGVSAICGDSEVPGRVYLGMPGGSFFVGQVDGAAGSSYAPTKLAAYDAASSPWEWGSVQGNAPVIVNVPSGHFPKAARFTLDDTTRPAWDETVNRRTEVSGGTGWHQSLEGTTTWEAGTIWLPANIVPPTNNPTTGGWLYLAQWHHSGSTGIAPLAIRVPHTTTPPILELQTANHSSSPVFNLGLISSGILETIDGVSCRRFDWKLKVTWSNALATGRVSAWVNGVLKVDNQAAATRNGTDTNYPKEGGYGNRYTTGTTQEPPVTIFHTGRRFGSTEASITTPALMTISGFMNNFANNFVEPE